jgi:hypothetical protein
MTDIYLRMPLLKPAGDHRSFARSKDNNDFIATESKKYDTIVGYFVDEITSPYDQDISLLLVGNKGRGKSRAALSLCYYAACELAERKGGEWKDYFDPETHLAVISPTKASEVMKIKDKYAVKDFDDIGIGWGARNWQKKENIEKGEVFQINRIDRQLQVFSVPNQFLLDKIPRTLVSHYAEMDQQYYEFGFSTLKLFKPITLFREGKIIQPYLTAGRTKYILYRIPKPPEFLDKIYTKIRKDATTEAISNRLEQKTSYRKELEKYHTVLPRFTPIEHITRHRAIIDAALALGGNPRERWLHVRNCLVATQEFTIDRINQWRLNGKFVECGIIF